MKLMQSFAKINMQRKIKNCNPITIVGVKRYSFTEIKKGGVCPPP